MKHKHIALEVLKKLLNDEIKTRIKKNLIIEGDCKKDIAAIWLSAGYADAGN